MYGIVDCRLLCCNPPFSFSSSPFEKGEGEKPLGATIQIQLPGFLSFSNPSNSRLNKL